jgi:hypothetical protein
MANNFSERIEELEADRRKNLREAKRARKRSRAALKRGDRNGYRAAKRTAKKNNREAQTNLKNIRTLRSARTKANAFSRLIRHRRSAGTSSNGYKLYWFDGKKVTDIAYKHLVWARYEGHNGRKWKGYLTSGFRTPEYSRSLCYAMCGASRCSGRCAGDASNHVRGAIDVTDYNTFESLMPHSPFNPKYKNTLDWRDPVHFSATGN